MAKSGTKKRKVVVESTGEAHITASFNNIIISLTNKNGDVISWSSANIIDANVDAHLLQYNLDENLSIKPNIDFNKINNESNFGISLKLKL